MPPPPPAWLRALIDEANEAAADPPSREEWERIRPRVSQEHAPIEEQVHDYRRRVHRLCQEREAALTAAAEDAFDVIAWFHTLIGAKIHRALTVWPRDDPDDEDDSDADGSAKVALLGIDESHKAWLRLVEHGLVTAEEAAQFFAGLEYLREALERARPRAGVFVRPGLDEPDAVRRLVEEDCRP